MKIMMLISECFEVHTSNMHNVAPITGCDINEIFKCYSNPSQRKVAIWEYWCAWCHNVQDLGYECGIQIESYNGFSFTISGHLNIDGIIYDLWITKSHNRLYKHK